MGYFLFFTQYGELIINLKWNKNDHAGISVAAVTGGGVGGPGGVAVKCL